MSVMAEPRGIDARSRVTEVDMNHQDAHQAMSGAQWSGHAGHGWMIAFCAPMLAIAVALVATGVFGPGFVFIALLCIAMMVMMMRGMSQGDGGKSDHG